ncbi:MAG TPA: CPBP family intramembrane glutamic endopeptidase [Thermomicrobiales bacterium]|nr:CPBP family intramembrane glutamic endopeptidase [Thermomicrobiales bacterium]
MAGRALAAERRLHASVRENAILVILCFGAGVAPLAARSISGDAARVAYGALVAAAYLAFALFARRAAALRPYWELAFAFFVFAFVQVLNNVVAGYVASRVLRAPPTAGDPLAATVSGTVVVQLLETAVAIIPVVAFTLLSGRDLGTIYARVGKRRWLVGALVFFAAFYGYLATVAFRPDSPAHRLLPTNGPLTLARFLALTPALLVVAIANGFEEEFLFRGLFLQKYTVFFGAGAANALQAALFATAHAWITYTPTAVLFIVAVVFPLGLLAGYLMRASDGIVVPGIVHAALDLAIYLAFLTYAV